MMDTMIRETSSDTAPESAARLPLVTRIRIFIARSLFILGALVLAVFVISRLATDRFLLSQYAYWVPAWIYLAPAAILLLFERVIARRSALPRWRAPSWWMLLFCAASASVIAWRGMESSATFTKPDNALSIVQWNMSSPDMLNFEGTLADFRSCKEADIILLGVTVPDRQFKKMVNGLGGDWTYKRVNVFGVASRYPIERAAAYPLGLFAEGSRPKPPFFQEFYNERIAERFGLSRREFDLPDPGYVIDVRVKTPQGSFSIRMLDLPSNPFRSRMELARSAADRIYALAKEGIIEPAPDLIIGDLNIPAGSASLSQLADGMVTAQSVSQSGDFRPTWPRAMPLLRIDQAWVRPTDRVLNYRTFDATISDHRGQFLCIERTPPSGKR